MKLFVQIGVGIVFFASVITAMSVIWTKFLGRYIARPIAKVIRQEFEEAIEQVVVQQIGFLPMHIGKLQAQVESLRKDMNELWKQKRANSRERKSPR